MRWPPSSLEPLTERIDVSVGLTLQDAKDFAKRMGFSGGCQDQAADIILKLYQLFRNSDATLVEINPMAEDVNREVFCMDCKMLLSEGSTDELKAVFKDGKQENKLEVRAAVTNFKYFPGDGTIGSIVGIDGGTTKNAIINKAHGDAASMIHGVKPNIEQLMEAFKIIRSDANAVNAILVNVGGRSTPCDLIAQRIIDAAKELDLKIPIVVRLQGTKVGDGKALIATSQLQIYSCDKLDEAALMVVALSNID